MDEYHKNEMMAHHDTKLKDPYNDCDTFATKYICIFGLYVRKLENLEGSWPEEKNIQELKDMVKNEEYDTELHVHSGLFDDLVQYFQII